MNAKSTADDSLVRSYMSLRKSIGVIGIALPFVLAIGGYLLRQLALQPSISHYYHTVVGDIFVGSLCAIAVFLWSYCGHGHRDKIATNLASVCAVGVALFPTARTADSTASEALTGTIHFLFAAALFITLAYISLKLFRLTDRVSPTPQKIARNRVYATCGYVMLACIALIALVKLLLDDSQIMRMQPVFWLEAAAIIAFGVSWLTKGEAIMKDRVPRGADLAYGRTAPHIPQKEEAAVPA